MAFDAFIMSRRGKKTIQEIKTLTSKTEGKEVESGLWVRRQRSEMKCYDNWRFKLVLRVMQPLHYWKLFKWSEG